MNAPAVDALDATRRDAAGTPYRRGRCSRGCAGAPARLRPVPGAAPHRGAHPQRPRFGDALRPGEEPVRFAQEPSLIFAPAAISALTRRCAAAAHRAARVRLARPERRAADAPDRVRARAPAAPRRPDASARFLDTLLHRLRAVLLSGLGAGPAGRRPGPGATTRQSCATLGALSAGRAVGAQARRAPATTRSSSSPAASRAGPATPTACRPGSQRSSTCAVAMQQFCGHWMALGAANVRG